MGFHSFLRSPKKEEEQEVPDNSTDTRFVSNTKDEELDIMDELEGILGIEEDESLPMDSKYGQLNWEFMDWEEFPDEEEEREQKVLFENTKKSSFEDESYYGNKVIKKENIGFGDDDDEKRVSLNLNLNYEEVLDAWSNRGSLWADDCSLSMPSNGYYMGEVPVMEEERTRREASVLRYKEKRQNRLFSKKIRYHVRKLNADKRPRLKGRFVKRVS